MTAALLRDDLSLDRPPAFARYPSRRRRPIDAGADAPEIILDLSRLLSRVRHGTPTGVDRVEMAYAQTLLELAPDRIRFAAVHPCGAYGRLHGGAVRAFLEATADQWRQGGPGPKLRRWLCAAGLMPLPPLQLDRVGAPRRRVYLHLSARALERQALYRAILQREQAAFVTFVHDLIPLEFPEYARPGGASQFRRKLSTTLSLASGVIANSEATARSLAPWLERAGRPEVPVRVAPLAPARFTGARHRAAQAYFVIVGTIEPRKNHILLLHIWRRLVALYGSDAPRLMVIGRRGWENENILDLLERSPALRASVEEHGGLDDRAVGRLLAGACAVLAPSFAEGYGLPVVEALAAGVPVIASDLAALREAGGQAPEYLDPLDGAAWTEAILAYAAPDSPRRRAQLARLAAWRAPDWRQHVATALTLMDEVAKA